MGYTQQQIVRSVRKGYRTLSEKFQPANHPSLIKLLKLAGTTLMEIAVAAGESTLTERPNRYGDNSMAMVPAQPRHNFSGHTQAHSAARAPPPEGPDNRYSNGGHADRQAGGSMAQQRGQNGSQVRFMQENDGQDDPDAQQGASETHDA